ncbi:MAG TPA: ABC transporter permease [Xanthobacteraceae bacterium]|jgi:NitT/TauT family transport system permease protein
MSDGVTQNQVLATPQLLSLEDVEAKMQNARTKRGHRDRIFSVLFPTLMVVALLVLWEAATRILSIPVFLLPPPSVIARSVQLNSAILLQESIVTTVEIALGFGLSILVGVPLALAIFMWPSFARTVYPLLVSSQAVPKVAIAPLFLVWFGFGLIPKVLIAFLIAFFPVVINTAMGLAAIEREKVYLAQSMGLSAVATFFKIRLPNALPSIFAGLKISITLAVVGAIVGEFVGGQAGLGYLLLIANGSMDTALMFAGLVALTIIGVVFFLLIGVVERMVLPRHVIEGASGAREAA